MVLRPVGARPAGVYWRRRVVLLAVLVVVVLVLVKACGGGGAAKTGSGMGTPAITPAAPTISACGAHHLSIAVTPEAPTDPAGEPMSFSATVTSTAAQPCRVLVTPSREIWSITSGTEQIWSDAGCPDATAGLHRVLKPGRIVTLHRAWDGHASTSNCQPGTAATAGTYHVSLQLGGATSPAKSFVLTAATATTSAAQG